MWATNLVHRLQNANHTFHVISCDFTAKEKDIKRDTSDRWCAVRHRTCISNICILHIDSGVTTVCWQLYRGGVPSKHVLEVRSWGGAFPTVPCPCGVYQTSPFSVRAKMNSSASMEPRNLSIRVSINAHAESMAALQHAFNGGLLRSVCWPQALLYGPYRQGARTVLSPSSVVPVPKTL